MGEVCASEDRRVELLLLWRRGSPCCWNFWAPWEEEVDELLLAVERGGALLLFFGPASLRREEKKGRHGCRNSGVSPRSCAAREGGASCRGASMGETRAVAAPWTWSTPRAGQGASARRGERLPAAAAHQEEEQGGSSICNTGRRVGSR
jgi:hypothetical protein